MTYAQRLQYFSIPSLERRRLHLDLLFCYKIVFGLVDINFLISLNFLLLVTPEGRHINSFRVFKGLLILHFVFYCYLLAVYICLQHCIDIGYIVYDEVY